MSRIGLQALILVGPTVTRPVLDPLAVLNLNNRLYVTSFNLNDYKYIGKDPPYHTEKVIKKKRKKD